MGRLTGRQEWSANKRKIPPLKYTHPISSANKLKKLTSGIVESTLATAEKYISLNMLNTPGKQVQTFI